MKVVIVAGGYGSRIASVNDKLPKPMIPIAGIPVLERIINVFRTQGFCEFIITVSHKSNSIINYFGDGNKVSAALKQPFGVKIDYYVEEIPLGNAGALFKLKNELSDPFFVCNADLIFDIDTKRVINYHINKRAWATVITHPNSHPYDSELIVDNEEGVVTQWLTKDYTRHRYYKNCVNAGIQIISHKALDYCQSIGGFNSERKDLDRDILRPLVSTGHLYSYHTTEYIKDMGTPERYEQVIQDLEKGLVEQRKLSHCQKAVFLDRDGTINKYKGFITNSDDFELIPGVSEAINLLHENGYLVVVITNQPVIARGEVTYQGLEMIHNKMEFLLSQKGAYLDGIYFCPHHPDRGFDGEVGALKRVCDCRKPKPGLLFKAAKELNIDLNSSWMIGDSNTDIEAGHAAQCRTGFICNQYEKINTAYDVVGESLFDIVRKIIRFS